MREDACAEDLFQALYKALYLLEDMSRVPNSAKVNRNAELFVASLKKFKWDLNGSLGLLGDERFRVKVIRE